MRSIFIKLRIPLMVFVLLVFYNFRMRFYMKTNAPSRKKGTVPVINMDATGHRICVFREKKRMSVKQLQELLGFDTPQAIYKWQRGQSLPSIDNLVALAVIFDTTIDKILVVEDVNTWKLKNMERDSK